MKVTVNVSKVQDTSKPVDTGTYSLLIKKAELKQPKDAKNGYPYVACRFEITDGPYAGRNLFCNLTTNPEETKNGSAKCYLLFQLLQVLNLVDDEMTPAEMGDIEFDTDDLVNQEVVGKVSINSDGDQNNIDKFMSI